MGQLLTFHPGQESTPVSVNFTAGEWRTSPEDGGDWQVHSDMVEIAQAARDILGGAVHISSGYRTPAAQRRINPGVVNSYHVRGKAMDIWVRDMSGFQLAGLINAIHEVTGLVGGLGIPEQGSLPYPSVHVSVDGSEGRWVYPPVEVCRQRGSHDKCTSRLTDAWLLRLENETARWRPAVQAWLAGSEPVAPRPVPAAAPPAWTPPAPSVPPSSTAAPPPPPAAINGILPAIGIVAGTLGLLVILA